MKKSNYNIFVKQKGFVICYNSFTHTLICVSNHVYDSFMSMAESDFKRTFKSHYDTLVSSGFLISDERDELAEIRLKHKIATFSPSRRLRLMVYPTQDCNLKCWYCYESHVANSKMGDEVKQNILKYIEKKVQLRQVDSFVLSFFGGEPLLYFDEIAYPLADKAREICKRAGVNYTSFFITNGTLINKENIDKLRSTNPVFQITLDGNKEKHDKVRIGKINNAETYDKILDSLYLISDNIPALEEDFVVTLRINYDDATLGNIDPLIKDLQGLDRSKFLVHMERVWQTMESAGDKEQRSLLLETIRKFQKEGFTVQSGNMKIRDYSCPAEDYDFAIINYDGNVYRCNGRTLKKENAEGILTHAGDIVWNQVTLSKRLGRTTFENPMCLACKMLPVCMGPCSQKCMELNWKDLHKVCSMQHMGMSIDKYLLLWVEQMLLQSKKSKI